MDLSQTLILLQQQLGFHNQIGLSNQTEEGMANGLDALTWQQNVIDLPLVPTKATIFIYLNAMVPDVAKVKRVLLIIDSYVAGPGQMIMLC